MSGEDENLRESLPPLCLTLRALHLAPFAFAARRKSSLFNHCGHETRNKLIDSAGCCEMTLNELPKQNQQHMVWGRLPSCLALSSQGAPEHIRNLIYVSATDMAGLIVELLCSLHSGCVLVSLCERKS